MGLEEPSPVVGARARCNADGAGRQAGDEGVQLGSWHVGADEFGLAGDVDRVGGEDVLGEIAACEYD
jgi:hypothetical protein